MVVCMSIIKKIWSCVLKPYWQIKRLVKIGQERLDSLIDDGYLGSYIKICNYLKCQLFIGLIPVDKAKRLLYQLEMDYDEIRPHRLTPACLNRIGEIVPRYNIMVLDSQKNKNKRILDIVRIYTNGDVNRRMIEIMRRNYTCVLDNDCKTWTYVLKKFSNVNFKYEDIYKIRDGEKYTERLDSAVTAGYWELSENEMIEGREKTKQMGIKGGFVCFSNRDDRYLKETIGDWFSYHNHRNSDIRTRIKMVSYLNDNNVQCVRMGKYAAEPFEVEGVIDYAFKYYDELMDIYLSRYCLFYVSDNSGVNSFAYTFGKLQVFTNEVALLGDAKGSRGLPQREDNLLIFKKIWSKRDNRFLNLKEIIDVQYRLLKTECDSSELDVVFIENSADEILDVVKEMYMYLEGNIEYSEEEIAVHNRAKKIINDKYNEHGAWEAGRYIGRLGISFLMNNREIFEI